MSIIVNNNNTNVTGFSTMTPVAAPVKPGLLKNTMLVTPMSMKTSSLYPWLSFILLFFLFKYLNISFSILIYYLFRNITCNRIEKLLKGYFLLLHR